MEHSAIGAVQLETAKYLKVNHLVRSRIRQKLVRLAAQDYAPTIGVAIARQPRRQLDG
jgi:hypothetical protein